MNTTLLHCLMPRQGFLQATRGWTEDRALARAALVTPLAVLAALPLLSLAVPGVGLAARAVVLCLLGLAVVRPAHALLVCAGLASLANPLGTALATPFGFGEPLVLAFVSGWLVHEALWPRRDGPAQQAALTPALLFAATIAASCAVPLFHLPTTAGNPLLALADVWTFLTREFFAGPSRFQTISSGMVLLEGIALFVALVTLARRTDLLATQVARMVVVCAAGAATLNASSLITASLRGGVPITDLMWGDPPIRISFVFPDVNAAGSYFAMTLVLAGGLFLAERQLRPAWGTAFAAMAGALWLTGSRAAFAAVPPAAACVAALEWIRAPSWRRVAVGGLVIVGLSCVSVGWFLRLHDQHRSVATAWSVRVEMGRTALRMFGAHPVFGVGVGRFYGLSARFSSAEIKRLYPRENAHNNFLQILAELGLVGLALFGWLLWAVGCRIWRALRSDRLSPPALGAAGGVIAFLLTCLAGHPLLVPEVSYAFWLVLGLAASLVPEPAQTAVPARAVARRSRRSVVAGALFLFLAVSLPVRARQQAAESIAGGPREGLSDTQVDDEGMSFRWMDARAQLFVPADARAVTLPLRLDPHAIVRSAAVEISLDGRLLSRLVLAGHNWHEFRFIMPSAPPDTNFRRIELRYVPSDETAAADRSRGDSALRIQVGRPRLTGPPS